MRCIFGVVFSTSSPLCFKQILLLKSAKILGLLWLGGWIPTIFWSLPLQTSPKKTLHTPPTINLQVPSTNPGSGSNDPPLEVQATFHFLPKMASHFPLNHDGRPRVFSPNPSTSPAKALRVVTLFLSSTVGHQCQISGVGHRIPSWWCQGLTQWITRFCVVWKGKS